MLIGFCSCVVQLPSSSSKFVDMTAQALERFAEENGFKFKKITRMPLEGDGTIRKKVLRYVLPILIPIVPLSQTLTDSHRVYKHLINNEEWMEDLHAADVIFVASHSQGAIISTHLVDRLIEDGHILTSRSVDVLAKSVASIAAGGAAAVPATQAQKVCLLALCGIHLGPLRYLKTSSLLQPYIQVCLLVIEGAMVRGLTSPICSTWRTRPPVSCLSSRYAAQCTGAFGAYADHVTGYGVEAVEELRRRAQKHHGSRRMSPALRVNCKC